MRGVRRRGIAVVGLVLGVWLSTGSPAWGSYSVSALCTAASQTSACSSSWYTSNVLISWTWSPNDGGNPTSGCVTHSYATDTSTTVGCTVKGPSGTTSVALPIRIELSTPKVVALPTRRPDSHGWYNHPVTFAFGGRAFSGIASCTTATYTAPNTPRAHVTGSCTDNAGKTTQVTSAPFAYDDARPALRVKADTGDQLAVLDWTMKDVAPSAGFRIVRRPGLRGRGSSVLYRGEGNSFSDHRVRNGVRYRYTLTAFDRAGNATVRTLSLRPGPRLLSPAQQAHLSRAPMLSWTPVRRASYYNVQIFKGKRELLSAWPGKAKFKLSPTWSFKGHRYRLRPGTYRWYVWPGFGSRAAARYGSLIGTRTFVVVRAK